MNPVSFSSAAAARLKAELAEHIMDFPLAGIRVGVKGGGCSGFTYEMAVDTNGPKDRDFAYSAEGVPVFVDPISAQYLKGTTVDFFKTGLIEGFKFNSPNPGRQCGCGKSFSA